jgi:hypothetical protein
LISISEPRFRTIETFGGLDFDFDNVEVEQTVTPPAYLMLRAPSRADGSEFSLINVDPKFTRRIVDNITLQGRSAGA